MKFSMKKKEGKEAVMNIENYDIMIDGELVEPNRMLSVEIIGDAGSRPIVKLAYRPDEVDIDFPDAEINPKRRSDLTVTLDGKSISETIAVDVANQINRLNQRHARGESGLR